MTVIQPSPVRPRYADSKSDAARRGRRARWGTTWIDWVAAGLYFGLSTQFSQRALDDFGLHLVLTGIVAITLVFRTRFPLSVLVAVTVVTCSAVLLGWSAEPLVAAGWTTAAFIATRPPQRPRGILLVLAVVAALLVFFMGGTGGSGMNWGQWIVLSFLCVAAGVAFGSNAATTREAVEVAAQMREENALQEERLRIAREIHDVSSNTLVSIGVQASASAAVDKDPAALRRSLQAIEVRSKEAAKEIRHYLAELRTDGRRHGPGAGFEARIRELAERARRTGVRCALTIDVDDSVDPASQEAICRALGEALTNVAKHAEGSAADVKVLLHPHERSLGARVRIGLVNAPV